MSVAELLININKEDQLV
ncbi:MAG TPA: hypothetical protein PK951_10465, partial [Chitinophagaceae bacterium]|nr:hypothetical protein [Chitinophagaceae bacterium]